MLQSFMNNDTELVERDNLAVNNAPNSKKKTPSLIIAADAYLGDADKDARDTLICSASKSIINQRSYHPHMKSAAPASSLTHTIPTRPLRSNAPIRPLDP
jgi:hypothetical protein